MRSNNSKSSTPSGDEKPADSAEITPAIAVDPATGAMRDIPPISPAPLADLSGLAAEPPAEFSHTIWAYGAKVQTTLDHTHARVHHVDGEVRGHTSRLIGPDGKPEEPTGFAKAIAEAKQRWAAEVTRAAAEQIKTRQERIDAAIKANQRGAS
jgi:hypothetical protein